MSDQVRVVYIDVEARDDRLESDLRSIARRAGSIMEQGGLQAGRELGEGIASAASRSADRVESNLRETARTAGTVLGQGGQAAGRALGEGIARGAEGARSTGRVITELDRNIKGLTTQVNTVRSAYQAGFTTEAQFRAETTRLKSEIQQLGRSTDLTEDQVLKLNRAGATAERGLASLRGEASRLGIAQQVNIGLSSRLQGSLARFGPAGSAASLGISAFGSSAAALPPLLGVAIPAAAALAVAGLVRAADRAAELADEIDKGAKTTGLSAEAYQELRFVFDQNGISADKFQTTIGTLNARIGLAANGVTSYSDTFKQLGIDIRDANGEVRSTEDVFNDVITRLDQVPSAAQKAGFASRLFGERVGREMGALLEQGSEGIARLRKEATDLGLVISGSAITSLVQYKDQMAALRQQFQTARVEITAAFLPVLTRAVIPLIQNVIVPLLQDWGDKLQFVADRFVDAGEEGQVFRAEVAAGIAPTVALGQSLVALARISVGLIQVITAPFRALGDTLGAVRRNFGDFVDRYRRFFQGDFTAFAGTPASVLFPEGELTRIFESALNQASAGLANVLAGGESFLDALDLEGIEEEIRSHLERAVSGVDLAPRNLFGDGGGLGDVAGTQRDVKSATEVLQDAFDNAAAAERLAIAQGYTLGARMASLQRQIQGFESTLGTLTGTEYELTIEDQRVKDALEQVRALSTALKDLVAEDGKIRIGIESERSFRATPEPTLIQGGTLPGVRGRAADVFGQIDRVIDAQVQAWRQAEHQFVRQQAAVDARVAAAYATAYQGWRALEQQLVRQQAAVEERARAAYDAAYAGWRASEQQFVRQQAAIDERTAAAYATAYQGWRALEQQLVRRQAAVNEAVAAAYGAAYAEWRNSEQQVVRRQAAVDERIAAAYAAAYQGWRASEQQFVRQQAAVDERTEAAYRESYQGWRALEQQVVRQQAAVSERAAAAYTAAYQAWRQIEQQFVRQQAAVREREEEAERRRQQSAAFQVIGRAILSTPEGISGSDRKFGTGPTFFGDQKKAAEEAAKRQIEAGKAFEEAVARASVQFAQTVVDAAFEGDAGGIARGAFNFGGSILGAIPGLHPITSILLSGGLGILGSIFGRLLNPTSPTEDAAVGPAAAARGAPAVQLEFNNTQNIEFSGGLNDPAVRQGVRGLALETFETIAARLSYFQRLAELETKVEALT